MTAEAERFADPRSFADAIAPLVRRDPIGATMVSHVLAGELIRPYSGGPPLMVAVRVENAIVLAALRTPGYPVLVVLDPELPEPDPVLEAFVRTVLEHGEPVVGFSGRSSTVRPLGQCWTERTGRQCAVRMSTLFYRLSTLVPPRGVPGSSRPADLSDAAELDLLARWLDEFGTETGVARGRPAPDREMVLANADRGEVTLLWCVDGRPVAMAGHSAIRNGVSRIAPVYTPPEHRRRRYGAAVTAAAVQSAWSLGADEVTLFADVDYEPANAVYRGLGFQPITEFSQLDCRPS